MFTLSDWLEEQASFTEGSYRLPDLLNFFRILFSVAGIQETLNYK